MRNAVFSLALIISLSGCVVLWGRAYEIEAETSEWITIKYDPTFTSLADVQQVAQGSCNTDGKRAVVRDQSTSLLHLTTVNFDCAAK